MKKFLMIILVSFSFSACEDWLTIQPETMVTPDELFMTPNGYGDALTGCYQLMADVYSYNGPMVTGMIESMACSWETTKKSTEEVLGLHEYTDDKADSQMGSTFKKMFKVLANVSELVRYLDEGSAKLDEEDYNNFMGQALGMRAFIQLELMRVWGPMPSDVKIGKKYLPYVEQIQVQPYEYLDYDTYMKKVENDLKRAESMLTKKSELVKEYINHYAILALQARFYFWKGDKENALLYAEKLMEPETLRLFPIADKGDVVDYSVLLKDESIWSYSFSSSESVQLPNFNYSAYVRDDLFEGITSDVRLNFWDLKPAEGSETDDRMLLTKYNVEQDEEDDDELAKGGVPLIRISEIYFMLMEMYDLDKANALYEEFCKARRIPQVHFASRGELLKRLELEYRREFIGEGQMFFQYKRWATVNMPRCKRGCGETAYVPPIPSKEYDVFN